MKRIALLALLVLLAATAQSQTTDSTGVVTKIKNVFQNSEQFKLSGYGQAMYYTSDAKDLEVNNDFRVNRIILFATGNLTKQLSYMLMYDFGPKSCLVEVYGEYALAEAAKIRFGQYKVPLTIENPMSPTRWEGIFNSLAITALTGNSKDIIGSKAGRDIGLQLSGRLFKDNDFYRVEYAAGLFNGAGFNTPDNNNHKDFAGTLFFYPMKDLKLAGSVYAGKAHYLLPGETSPSDHVRNRWSMGAEINQKHWYARSEYIYGNDGGIDRDGYYATGTWKILPDKLEVFGKYDYYNPYKDSESTTAIKEYTGGVNYYLAPLTRLQLNYIYNDNKIDPFNTLAVQMQLFF